MISTSLQSSLFPQKSSYNRSPPARHGPSPLCRVEGPLYEEENIEMNRIAAAIDDSATELASVIVLVPVWAVFFIISGMCFLSAFTYSANLYRHHGLSNPLLYAAILGLVVGTLFSFLFYFLKKFAHRHLTGNDGVDLIPRNIGRNPTFVGNGVQGTSFENSDRFSSPVRERTPPAIRMPTNSGFRDSPLGRSR